MRRPLDKPVPVLFVSHFPHMRMGGQRSMAALIERLDRSRYSPLAVTTEPGELSEHLSQLDCPVHFFPLNAVKGDAVQRVVGNTRRFRRMYHKERIRIVHPDAEQDVIVAGLGKIGLPTQLLWHVRVTGKNRLDRVAARLADQIVGVSDGVGRRFAPKLLNGKYQTVFNGVDLDRFRPAENKGMLREQCRMPVDRPVLLFAGQIKASKGVFDMVEGMELLREKGASRALPMLYLVGEPINSNEYERLKRSIAERNLEKIVHLLPQQNNVQDWMAASDLLLLPSHEGSEGMGRVIFEAMACGIVPVASDISGVREAITPESGILIPQKDPAALAEAVGALLEDTERIDLLRKGGLRRARDVFDIRLHARNIEQVYEKMLGQTPA